MSLLIRHRKVLFAAVIIVASGYASYRLYKSRAFVQRQRKLLQIVKSISIFGQAIFGSAESIAMISKDLKEFLSSDAATVPRSLKQVFKLGQCEEFQETATILSAALTRGLFQASKSRNYENIHSRRHESDVPKIDRLRSMHEARDSDSLHEDVVCREIREVCFTIKSEGASVSFDHGLSKHELERPGLSNLEEDISDYKEDSRQLYSVGYNQRPESLRQIRNGTHTELSDRILSKMLSDPGVGFISAVAGAMARNFVRACFDGFSRQTAQDVSSVSSSNNKFVTQKAAEIKPLNSKFLDVIGNEKSRALITESIQTFVSTAVTIYIEKMKDVNFYDGMVAGITNPSHKAEMKDVLTSLCNGAIETFVRISYDVSFNGMNGLAQGHPSQKPFQMSKLEIEHVDKTIPEPKSLLSSECISRESSVKDLFVNKNKNEIANEGSGGMQTFIEGVSRAIAIPSNRELALDIAGKMSYEAVRSCFQVMTDTVSSYLSWSKMKRHVFLGHAGMQLQESYDSVAAKAFILVHIWIALCLHMLTGLHLAEKY